MIYLFLLTGQRENINPTALSDSLDSSRRVGLDDAAAEKAFEESESWVSGEPNVKRRRKNANAQCLKRIAATYDELKTIEESKLDLIKINELIEIPP